MMNFTKLRYVIAVAEEQSITKAAKKLFISQPSLSLCIRSIEDELGTDLFIRGKTHVTLTYAGELYVEWAKATLESAKRLQQQLDEMTLGAGRQLTIGTSWQRSAVLLPEVIDNFLALEPDYNIKIKEELNANLHTALSHNEVDMIIGTPSADNLHCISVPLFQERFLLAASEDISIPHTDGNPYPSVDESVLLGKSVVMLQKDQHVGAVFRELLLKLNYSPSTIVECYNLETAHTLVSKNVGVTLLPEISVFYRTMPGVNYYFFTDKTFSRPVAAVYPKNHLYAQDIQKFIALLRAFLNSQDYPFITS